MLLLFIEYLLTTIIATKLGMLLWSLALLVMINHIHFLWKYRQISKVPGPPSLPIFGAFLYMRNQDKILSRSKWIFGAYGPTVQVAIGPKMNILTCDKDMIEFFLKSPRFLKKSYHYNFLDPWLGIGLLNSIGETWQKTRKMITPAFHFKILENHVKIFDSASDVFIEVLKDKMDAGSFDIHPLVTNFTLDIIAETGMGIQINAQTQPKTDYVKAVHYMTSIPFKRSLSIWKWNDFLFQFTSDYRKQQSACKILDEMTINVIHERKKILLENNHIIDNMEKSKKSIFLDIMLTSTIDGEPLSDEKIKCEVNSFMFGGHDTTASTITFMIYELANNAEVQNKVVDELRMIFGNDRDRHCTMQDLSDMKYMDLVIKEVLRYYVPVPFIGRQITEDVEYGGITYPKNMTFLLFFYMLHKDPNIYKDPKVFNPERFLDETTLKPFTFLPFSAGPRNCLGQKYAVLEIKVTIARLLRHFEFFSAGPKHKLILSPELVMKPSNGAYVQIKKRDF